MPALEQRPPGGRRLLVLATAVAGLVLAFAAPVVATGRSDVAAARAATARFHDIDVARDAGYERFYLCTDSSLGAMGQHFVNGGLVGDGKLDVATPEVLVYEPKKDGGWKLVAVEYVEIADVWDAVHDGRPRMFGRWLTRMDSPNRYGLPEFYQIHAWLWDTNPRGMFEDWNPTVTCRGNGDPA